MKQQTPSAWVDPYVADEPDYDCGEDASTDAQLGSVSPLVEYTPEFRCSPEYKAMRKEAQNRGKLGF